MAATNTFSPDAVLGGPIVHALRGDLVGFRPPTDIHKGDILWYGRSKTSGRPAFSGTFGAIDSGRAVVAAEAVQIYASQQSVSIPVVVSGRCDLNFLSEKKDNTFRSKHSQTINPQFGNVSTNLQFRFIHSGTVVHGGGKKSTLDVFMESFAA